MDTWQETRQRRLVVAIDDDAMLLSLVGELLEMEGYAVITHQRWDDAHPLIRNTRPDMVLLDLRLGDGQEEAGWRVLDLLTLDPDTRDIPVVLCSGAVESIQTRLPALLPGYGIGVLTKPFDLAALLDAVRAVLVPRPPSGPTRPERTPVPLVRRTLAPGHGSLTCREQEIAELIAQGCSNAEIAERLVLTRGTVANHVAHILNRLGLPNRAAVAAWAVAQRLEVRDEPQVIPFRATAERAGRRSAGRRTESAALTS